MKSELSLSGTEIKALFDRIAPVYDRLNDRLSFGMHRIWKLMTVKWSEASPQDVGLDLCCGSGDLTRLLAKQIGSEGKVIGVDFSAKLLAVARSRLPGASITWLEADALNLPFDDGYFDCATMGYGLRNVTDIPRCLQELYRVLKPGAKAAILDFNRPGQPYLRTWQEWYLQNIVVTAARELGLSEEYAYIVPSLEKFPTGSQQVKLAGEAGFSNAIHYSIAFGMMGVLVLTKSY